MSHPAQAEGLGRYIHWCSQNTLLLLLPGVSDSLKGDLCKTSYGILDQAYQVTASTVEEMLNSVNSHHGSISLQCYI